jgi:hypothetical protein
MLNINSAIQIVEEELRSVKREGYTIERIRSRTTNSSYYRISDGKNQIAFRISDHETHRSNISTLDLSYPITPNKVRGFVRNKVSGLKKRGLMSFFRN